MAQSVVAYCIPIWGGAAKTHLLDLEIAQRSLIKVMYFKPYRFSTDELYKTSQLLSIRKLYILQLILSLHKTIKFDSVLQNRRRNHMVAHRKSVRTAFAGRQYASQSAYVYNKINSILKIYCMNLYDCRVSLTKWLMTQSYNEVEQIITRIS